MKSRLIKLNMHAHSFFNEHLLSSLFKSMPALLYIDAIYFFFEETHQPLWGLQCGGEIDIKHIPLGVSNSKL